MQKLSDSLSSPFCIRLTAAQLRYMCTYLSARPEVFGRRTGHHRDIVLPSMAQCHGTVGMGCSSTGLQRRQLAWTCAGVGAAGGVDQAGGQAVEAEGPGAEAAAALDGAGEALAASAGVASRRAANPGLARPGDRLPRRACDQFFISCSQLIRAMRHFSILSVGWYPGGESKGTTERTQFRV